MSAREVLAVDVQMARHLIYGGDVDDEIGTRLCKQAGDAAAAIRDIRNVVFQSPMASSGKSAQKILALIYAVSIQEALPNPIIGSSELAPQLVGAYLLTNADALASAIHSMNVRRSLSEVVTTLQYGLFDAFSEVDVPSDEAKQIKFATGKTVMEVAPAGAGCLVAITALPLAAAAGLIARSI